MPRRRTVNLRSEPPVTLLRRLAGRKSTKGISRRRKRSEAAIRFQGLERKNQSRDEVMMTT